MPPPHRHPLPAPGAQTRPAHPLASSGRRSPPMQHMCQRPGRPCPLPARRARRAAMKHPALLGLKPCVPSAHCCCAGSNPSCTRCPLCTMRLRPMQRARRGAPRELLAAPRAARPPATAQQLSRRPTRPCRRALVPTARAAMRARHPLMPACCPARRLRTHGPRARARSRAGACPCGPAPAGLGAHIPPRRAGQARCRPPLYPCAL